VTEQFGILEREAEPFVVIEMAGFSGCRESQIVPSVTDFRGFPRGSVWERDPINSSGVGMRLTSPWETLGDTLSHRR